MSDCLVRDFVDVVPRGSRTESDRIQPFSLHIRSSSDGRRVILRCISPVGSVDVHDVQVIEQIDSIARKLSVQKICSVLDSDDHCYDLSVEGDILFHRSSTQMSEVIALVKRTVCTADRLEHVLFNNVADSDLTEFIRQLRKESEFGALEKDPKRHKKSAA